MSDPSNTSRPSDTTRVCTGGGFLVGPKARFPEDLGYFQTAGAKFRVGCNRLQCKLCGGMVRQQTGFRDVDADAASKHAREIYNTPDFSASPYLSIDANSRAYACGCSIVILTGGQTSPFPNGTWHCAGHPLVDGGTVLPPMSQQAATSFAVMIANSNLQESINALAITFTDGNGILAMPAQVSLGAGMPSLKLWTGESTAEPMDLDLTRVAGGCVQLKDKSLTAY